MKLSIRMKIFLPVMVLLTIFPLAAWLVFSQTLEAHMSFNAKKDLERLVRKTEEAMTESGESGEGGEDADLLEQLKTITRKEKGESQMIIMNGKFRVIYPKNYGEQTGMSQIYSTFLAENPAGVSSWEEETIFEKSFGEKK